MRTTVTLDVDVAQRIEDEMRCTGRGFKETVNDALRRALAPAPASSPPPLRQHGRSLGTMPGLDYNKVSELIEEIEGPWHR